MLLCRFFEQLLSLGNLCSWTFNSRRFVGQLLSLGNLGSLTFNSRRFVELLLSLGNLCSLTFNSRRFVELLLSRGAQVDVRNKKGNSSLWLAANGGHLDVVQLLYSAGADIDSQDNRKVGKLFLLFVFPSKKLEPWIQTKKIIASYL